MERIVISPRVVNLIRNGIMKGIAIPETGEGMETGEEVLLHCPERDFLASARIRRAARVSLWDVASQVYAHTFDPAKIGLTKVQLLHMTNDGIKKLRVLVFDAVEEYTAPSPAEELTMIGNAG